LLTCRPVASFTTSRRQQAPNFGAFVLCCLNVLLRLRDLRLEW
jgi:hypothetical protein